MASPTASIASLIALIVFFICYICWKLATKEDDTPAPAPKRQGVTVLRTTTQQRITGSRLASVELTTLDSPGVTPITIRRPSPIGWSDSTTTDSKLPHLPPKRLEASPAGVSNKLCPYPAENHTMPILPYPSPLTQSSAPYPVETTSNESMPYLPTIAKVSAPYPVETSSNESMPYLPTVPRVSAPYPVETTSNKSMPYLPTVAKISAPYPVEITSSKPLSHFPTITQYSAPYPIETPPKIQTSYPYNDIYSGDSEKKQKSGHSLKVTLNSAPYQIEELTETSLLNPSKYDEPSAPPVEETTKKTLPYPLEMDGISSPHPESLNIEMSIHQKSAPCPFEDSQKRSPYADTNSRNLDNVYLDSAKPFEIPRKDQVTENKSEEQIGLLESEEQGKLKSQGPEAEYPNLCPASYRRDPYLEPCSLIRPKKPGFKQDVMPYPFDDQRQETYTLEEDSQPVDTFRIGFVKPPEPGFKVGSVARGRTTAAVGSLGAAGPRGLNSGSKKQQI